ncbi:sensor histidine kinase [Teredinibacter purpureus]|uniref:sensor histidine kinase n=1 Tax=Teredinibacter purpureus TaxID=2731756 RepID=UPI0005F7C3C1|nr:HAMP domain-containing sensor histidine kinase [Teredinibacter purpureus]
MRAYFQKTDTRLALAIFTAFVLVGIFSISLFVRSSRAHQQEVTQLMNWSLADHVLHDYILFSDGEPDLDAAKHSFHELMILGPNFEFYLLNVKGEILAYSTDPNKIKRERVDIVPINQFMAVTPDGQQPIYGDDPRALDRKKVFSAAPIISGDKLSGYMYVVLGSEIYDDFSAMVAQSKNIRLAVGLLFAGILCSLLATVLLTRIVTRPLRELALQVSDLREKGFADSPLNLDGGGDKQWVQLQKWACDSENEIDILGSGFLKLLNKLDEQYKNVITIDQLRKELLSHVSHDLRTPLSSLLGYLETWEMNQTTLSPEKSAEYIATAKKSAQKISKLVEQLFELAHLDSGNVQVNIESFSIAELVDDVIQKFRFTAAEKHLSLSVSPRDSRIQVMGDIEKLERVFTNLIDNAIRHSKMGGSITVLLSKDSRLVAVEVTDNGIGIPSSDIPHVFEPHFKAGNSIRGNTSHGGLGLAITAKLLGLHQSAITVESEEDSGTTFSFRLPSVEA